MPDREKVIKGLERCLVCDMSLIASEEGQKAYIDCEYTTGLYCRRDKLLYEVLELLKEQEKLVDVDALREKLGLAKDCAKCKQNTRACQYDSHFSLMDFCERFDMAIEELMQEGR